MSTVAIPRKAAGLDSPRAWLVCLAGFLGAFVAFGVTYSFGVFMRPIAMSFGVSHAATSFLFSTLTVISFFLAPLTGDLADRFGPRPIVATGAILMGTGLVLTARVTYFPLIYLSYGVAIGAAVSCIYIPCVAAVGEWFKLHRDIALGLAISGIGCGTLVAAPVAAILNERYDWRTSLELFGWASTALLIGCAALVAVPPGDSEKKKANVEQKVKTRAFALLYVSLMFCGVAVYICFVFLAAFAADLGASKVAAATLLAYIGAASVVGRLGLNALAPRFGLLRMYQAAFAILLVSSGLWVAAHSYGVLVAFALVLGVGYGGVAAMAPAVVASIFGTESLGELLGIFFTGFGVACLIGPPLGGVLVDRTHDYRWPAYLTAIAALLALAIVLPLRATKSAELAQSNAAD